jgi:hypothetical protein
MRDNSSAAQVVQSLCRLAAMLWYVRRRTESELSQVFNLNKYTNVQIYTTTAIHATATRL